MPAGNKIIKRVKIEEFLEQIRGYSKEQIECTNHTFFRLSEKQREIYTCEKLREYLFYEVPFLVGLQEKGNYAVFYRHEKNKFIRIIVNIDVRKVNIVTFYFIEQKQIPRI